MDTQEILRKIHNPNLDSLSLAEILDLTDAAIDKKDPALAGYGKALLDKFKEGKLIAFYPKIIVVENLALYGMYRKGHALMYEASCHIDELKKAGSLPTNTPVEEEIISHNLITQLYRGLHDFETLRKEHAALLRERIDSWKNSPSFMARWSYVVDFMERHLHNKEPEVRPHIYNILRRRSGITTTSTLNR